LHNRPDMVEETAFEGNDGHFQTRKQNRQPSSSKL